MLICGGASTHFTGLRSINMAYSMSSTLHRQRRYYATQCGSRTNCRGISRRLSGIPRAFFHLYNPLQIFPRPQLLLSSVHILLPKNKARARVATTRFGLCSLCRSATPESPGSMRLGPAPLDWAFCSCGRELETNSIGTDKGPWNQQGVMGSRCWIPTSGSPF